MSKKKANKSATKKSSKKATKKVTIASVFRGLGNEEFKTRKAMAKKIVGALKEKGVTETIRKTPITVPKVERQVSAMIRDIENERKGWWATFNVEEKEDSLKIVPPKSE